MHGTVPKKIIWKRTSIYVKQEALETTTDMGAFARENYDLVTSHNKEIEAKEQELQSFKYEHSQANEHH